MDKEEEREKNREQFHECSLDRVYCETQGEGRNQVAPCTLCIPKHSCLSDQQIPWLNPMFYWAETRIQKCYVLATTTAKHKTKPLSLATSQTQTCLLYTSDAADE